MTHDTPGLTSLIIFLNNSVESDNTQEQKSMKASQHLIRRCKLLDAARGSLQWQNGASNSLKRKYPLPTFALKSHHVDTQLLGATPSEFHETLCKEIRNAQERVYLASLYIGPGASVKYEQEHDLLDALRSIKEHVNVRIILDQNRGLREVPCDNGERTSSAQAVADAIKLQDNHNLHLFKVLPTPLDAMLPNPLNEVAGVFHIKAYIIDDKLILSGANLSEEYFTDRQDRYLCVSDGGNGLVDFYAKLIDSLCDNSVAYEHGTTTTSVKKFMSSDSNAKLLKDINNLFCSEDQRTAEELLTEDASTIAVCMPTFHAPNGFWDEDPEYWTDIDATLSLLREGGNHDAARIHLASAYLNPMPELLKSVEHYPEVNFLTAGPLSHGFRPKRQQSGNKGTTWIPTVFDHLIHEASKETHASMWHWERQDWTFHSKGIWLEEGDELAAHVVGSSNFGGRSFERDMESNLIMILPPAKTTSEVSKSLQDELGELMKHSKQVNPKEVLDSAPELPMHIKPLVPFIKSFF